MRTLPLEVSEQYNAGISSTQIWFFKPRWRRKISKSGLEVYEVAPRLVAANMKCRVIRIRRVIATKGLEAQESRGHDGDRHPYLSEAPHQALITAVMDSVMRLRLR